MKKSFASDNNSGVHPDIFEAIAAANNGHVIAYGDDPFTERAICKVKEHFGSDCEAYFVFGGTAANVLGLKQITRSYHSILCSDASHVNNDECGAPERFTGCKQITVPSPNGKISIEDAAKHIHGIGFEHHSQPKVISIAQATEYGTVYSLPEIEAIAAFAHERGLLLHVDGARLCNAAAYLGVNLRRLTAEAGVDVLSFGGAKNGLMYGECIIFFDRKLAENFKYIRKQGMQLASKMRFISAQFEAYLSNDLWRKNAEQANAMALMLANEIEKIPEIKITQKVESNAVFAIVPAEIIPKIQEKFFFYVWNEETSEVRWMTSFDTIPEDICDFVRHIRKCLGKE
ncbi:MAG: low specificity L-threonine aldolase [Candidatus Omnitrophota bacterium]